MNLDQVTQDIESWIMNFVEVPHPALGGWPPCPFARQARLKKSYEICVGTDPVHDLMRVSQSGLLNKEVIIYAYDPLLWPRHVFAAILSSANQEQLLPRDLIALEDHPDDVEIVNGVCMNQGKYALALVQGASELDARAKSVAARGFYHGWPEEYLQGLFQHRQDPRV